MSDQFWLLFVAIDFYSISFVDSPSRIVVPITMDEVHFYSFLNDFDGWLDEVRRTLYDI